MTSNAAFKKKVRELAAREGIPYAEARRRLIGRQPKETADAAGAGRTRSRQLEAFERLVGRVLIQHAVELETADIEWDEAEESWVEAREREGLRVVSGGQIGPYNADGTTLWEVVDWRTDELLAEGTSTYDEMVWHADWVHIDRFEFAGQLSPDGALRTIPADTPPELTRFIEDLAEAMESDRSSEFAEWLRTRD
ncbi:hypothetical protein [Agromyces mangrovi Wang et al. 2018]|uniref:hypothetical protein n=1 Tax=Agromyces mangrovi TaxID=1858653 RepID=UPI0025743501|nr:hypothetical protein [Agromyces mangrovi]BDZ65457.1 hypothetical protein GCM10025877_23950 [Agromyces mangrovi]